LLRPILCLVYLVRTAHLSKDFWEDATVVLTLVGPVIEIIASWISRWKANPKSSKKRDAWVSNLKIAVGLFAGFALVKFTLLNRVDEQNSAKQIASLQEQSQASNSKLITQGTTLIAQGQELLSTKGQLTNVAQQADAAVTKLNVEIAKADAAAAAANLELARFAAPLHTIPVVGGVATPDLSHGLTQRVLLHSDISIAAPKLPHPNKDGTIVWTLFVDQDTVGNHTYTMNFLQPKTTWPGLVGNSRASYELITDSAGQTVMRSVPIVNALKPIP
jgi:hypothetical protein